jgi:hypothetical protein
MMDKIIQLSAREVNDLLETLAAHKERGSLYGLRVCLDGDYAKFKVNESTWSPPLGKLDPMCRQAARVRVDAVNETE